METSAKCKQENWKLLQRIAAKRDIFFEDNIVRKITQVHMKVGLIDKFIVCTMLSSVGRSIILPAVQLLSTSGAGCHGCSWELKIRADSGLIS